MVVVDIRVVDMEVIVSGVVELVVVELEVVGLVVGVVGEDCLREVEVVDGDYLIKVEIVQRVICWTIQSPSVCTIS